MEGTKMGRTGLTALEMLTISSNSSDSCLCLPEVSTMMTSNRSVTKQCMRYQVECSMSVEPQTGSPFRNFSTPRAAMATGSVSVYDPKNGILALVAFLFSHRISHLSSSQHTVEDRRTA